MILGIEDQAVDSSVGRLTHDREGQEQKTENEKKDTGEAHTDFSSEQQVLSYSLVIRRKSRRFIS